ncbi:MAG: magnesium/cobalt transporter CorA [Actinomycetales bacterium]
MIVDVATYVDGVRDECKDFAWSLAQLRANEKGFLWIGLKDPKPAEFTQVAEELGLHSLAVEDAVHGHQRPKLETYQHSTFLVLKTLQYVENTSDVETGEIMIFVGDRFIVTVRRGDGMPLWKVRQALEADPDLLARGPSVVLYTTLDRIVDTYLQIESELQQDLDRIERQVFAETRAGDAAIIYALKREVLEFRRSAMPLVEPVRRLAEARVPYVEEQAQPYFRDVLDHLLMVTDHVESQDRLLSDVLNAHLAQVSLQQNTDMRKISAWVAIAAFPTMVAGIYGMNFEHMPELRSELGYPIVLIVMVVVSVLLYRVFKRAEWL